MTRRAAIIAAVILALVSPLRADTIAKRVLAYDPASDRSLLLNGGLDPAPGGTPSPWRPYERGFDLDSAVSHTRAPSARCTNTSPHESRGLVQDVLLDQSVPLPIFAECWSKAVSISGAPDSDYSLYLDLEYTDGANLYAQTAPFATGTHDWQCALVTVLPTKPVRRLAVYALLRRHTGTAWFDDLAVWQSSLPSHASLFDHHPVFGPSPEETSPMNRSAISTSDGLTLDPVSGLGGFLLRDVAAGSDFIRPTTTAETQPDGSLLVTARSEALKLDLTATYRSVGSAIRIDADLRDLSAADRAITVYVSYPIDAVGWQWHDDQHRSRPISDGAYENLVDVEAGANGLASRYPLACISGPDDALALAVPLDVPRLCRLAYDADSKELYAAFDLGLTPETKRFPSRAAFSLLLYRPDPAWGFRSALQRYYNLVPQCFTKRNTKEGIWMPFTDISTVEGWQDFGFQFHEGNNNVDFDAAHDIYSFVYVEPWSYWMDMPADMPKTPDNALAVLHQQADEGSTRARATLTSLYEDAAGKPAVRIEDQPWCNGAVFGVNPAPGVPGSPSQFDNLMHRIDRAFSDGPQLSGVYHDSFEMYLFYNYRSYRRDHFAGATLPLVFDRQGRVCQFGLFTMLEFAREIADRMWPQGKLTFANGAPHQFPWEAAWLDVMGTEAAWASEWGASGEYRPEPDEDFCYYRALCYQRPYLMLLNTRFDLWQPAWFEKYMKRCTAYGVFPSMFSHNASEDPYWQSPDLYNRDRPLFKKYIPIVSALNAAGWRPITGARSDNPAVYIERFGETPDALYFTLLNDTSDSQPATITFHPSSLPVTTGNWQLHSLLGPDLVLDTSGPLPALTLTIAPEDTIVLQVLPK